MIQPLFWSHHGLWGSKAARAPPSSHPLPSLTPFWTSVVDQTPLISSHMGRVFPKVLPMTVLVSRTEGTRLIRAMLWIQEGQTQLLGTASYSSQAASTGFSVGFHWHRMGRVQECVIPITWNSVMLWGTSELNKIAFLVLKTWTARHVIIISPWQLSRSINVLTSQTSGSRHLWEIIIFTAKAKFQSLRVSVSEM